MKILSVGGGSGGHVTPAVAVLREIHSRHPDVEFRFWCDYHYAPQARRIVASFDAGIPVQRVLSGKFRRYHHLTKLQHLTIPSVVFPNMRDAILLVFGIMQSIFRLILWRPDVVYANGGYVCLPVGYAAWLLRIPLVIHDADAVAGLTNRLLAPLAAKIGTGLPLEYYDYPRSKATYVSVAISSDFKKVSDEQRKKLKKQLGFDDSRPLVVFTGGGQGARQINDAVLLHYKELVSIANVLLLSGASQYDDVRALTPPDDPRFLVKDFIPGLSTVFGAADIVVTRAGATALLELAAMEIPTIVIPSNRLVWQVEHVKVFEKKQAVIVLDEDRFKDPKDTSLPDAVRSLATNAALRKKLSSQLARFAHPQAAHDMADVIVSEVRVRK